MLATGAVTCPRCGFRFDVGYSRIVSCRTCSLATLGDCEYVRCPACGHEFAYKRAPRSWRSLQLP
ncbi:MAG: hypothetical protein QXU97_05405 [Fervidicoccaceae archaeon]